VPRVFSFAAWNVRQFGGNDQPRIQRIVEFLRDDTPRVAAPDVFAIFEVRSSTAVFNAFTSAMPNYQFFITVTPDSPLDTLVGVRNGITAFHEQREEFDAGVPSLRPGSLVTLVINQTNYSMLFLHLKAMSSPRGWGLRDDMVHHIRNLRRALDGAANGAANLIAIGDYNTVGLNVTYAPNDVTGPEEVERYRRVFAARDMIEVEKDQDATLWGGPGSTYDPADVDLAFASDHLDIRPGANGSGLSVLGWPALPLAQQGPWIENFSDHALLYGEVHT